MMYLHSLQSEWLKTKRSAASWMAIIGGFFIPIIYLILFLKDQTSINHYRGDIWIKHFTDMWQNMSVFLLPLGLILSGSLITQVEFRNNSWKQLHTTPQTYTTIFMAKFSVLVLMLVKFFVFFNLGILITGYLPCLLFDQSLPAQSIPVNYFMVHNARFFVACLPVMAFQFMISLQFRNFLVPIGTGFLALIGTLIGITWKNIVISPFSYCCIMGIGFPHPYNLVLMACLYFLALMGISYVLYISKKEKG